MLAPAASLVPLAAALLLASPAPAPGESPWRSVLALDEVSVDLDATAPAGRGPYTVQLRWRFADRAVSPQAWDEGVRYSIDVVDVDCRAGATRTRSSAAYAADGSPVEALSYDAPSPAWSRHRAESVGGMVARNVCALLGARH